MINSFSTNYLCPRCFKINLTPNEVIHIFKNLYSKKSERTLQQSQGCFQSGAVFCIFTQWAVENHCICSLCKHKRIRWQIRKPQVTLLIQEYLQIHAMHAAFISRASFCYCLELPILCFSS